MDTQIKEYLEKNILAELGLENLPPKKLEDFLAMLAEVIQGRINLRLLDELDDAAKDEFEKLLAAKSSGDKVRDFLKGKIQNFEEIVAQTIAESKQEIVERAKVMASA